MIDVAEGRRLKAAAEKAWEEYLDPAETPVASTPEAFEKAGVAEHDWGEWLANNLYALLDAAERAEAAERKLEQSSQALLDVIAERRRQMEVEGWSPAHDDEHTDKSLADAAACYLLYESPELVPKRWPWDPTWWKPKDYRRNCVRAAALVIAEIERVDRAAIDAKKWKR